MARRKKVSVFERFGRLVQKLVLPSVVRLRWRLRALRRPRSAGSPLVLTVTSYPPRFPTLALTLKSLLLQNLRPEFTILWVAHDDFAKLPPAVLALQADGLTIRTTADTRSYKKIIPAIEAFPQASLVIADDDTYYWPSWLEELVAAAAPGAREVVCHRAHRIILRPDGLPARYADWEEETAEHGPSRLLFPTGIGGVLYPPGIFAADVTRQDIFTRYCPQADDIWLFWMASLAGARFHRIGQPRTFITWFSSQQVGLLQSNVLNTDGNDRQIANMIEAYGFPARDA